MNSRGTSSGVNRTPAGLLVPASSGCGSSTRPTANTRKSHHWCDNLPWSHHLIILGQSQRPEEREFYLRAAVRERWSRRQLERQIRAATFERVVLSPANVSAALAQTHPEAMGIFKDSYMIEFLGLPREHSESDLHRGLVSRLKDFLIELGRDFCFVGSEYPLQVGKRDFAIDLLLFHRGLNCLCAIELKVGRFCSAPARTARSSSTPSAARCLRRSSPSTRPSCPTRSCSRQSCTSSTR
jgi:predicted nuclease of restriction endonuclease-like (RecB) superfamily